MNDLIQTPIIDLRRQADVATRLRALIAQYAPEYANVAAVAADKNVAALTQLFARLAEIAIQRVNRIPEKNLLAFLSMLGFDLQSPQPARVPLVFKAQASAPDSVLIPAGTQTALEGTDADPVIFETVQDLIISAAKLARVVSIDPASDRFTDHVHLVSGTAPAPETLFLARNAIPRSVYFGHSTLFDYKGEGVVQLSVTLHRPIRMDEDEWNLRWYAWSPSGPDPLELTPYLANPTGPEREVARLLKSGVIEFRNLPAPQSKPVSGWLEPRPGQADERRETESRWIFARLESSLPAARFENRVNRTANGVFANSTVIDEPGEPLFGPTPSSNASLLIQADDILEFKNGRVEMQFELEAPTVPLSATLISVEYNTGAAWVSMGTISSNGAVTGTLYDIEDETNAFTQSGFIKFFCPAIPRARPNAYPGSFPEGRWMRFRIVSGAYNVAAAPELSDLRLNAYNAPEIETVAATLLLATSAPRAPDAAAFNTSEIDVTRDFYPFGRKPDFNDTFYISSEEALQKPGAAVSLSFTRSASVTVVASNDLTLRFEYWNGSAWALLGETTETGKPTPAPADPLQFYDTTNGFTQTGVIGFVCPNIPLLRQNGTQSRWLRARIVQGNYGVEGFFNPALGTYGQFVPATYKPPSMASATFSFSLQSNAPVEQVVALNNSHFFDLSAALLENAAPLAEIVPQAFFRRVQDTENALYLGFDRAIANAALSLFLPVRPNPFTRASDDDSAQLLWERWTGARWSGVTINDGTRGLRRKDILQLLVPGDATSAPLFGSNLHWLRVRIESGSFARNPELDAIHLNTVYAENYVTAREELLGSSNGEPAQSFTLAKKNLTPGERIVVIEPAITEEDRDAVIAAEGADAVVAVLDANGSITGYRVRWSKVASFGLSGPGSRHYTLDPATAELRFGDGARGLIPPAGRNNIIAELYRYGGGARGNAPAGKVNQLRSALPIVKEVYNPGASEGGADQESLTRLQRRGPETIKHRDRAITPEDFESLARDASPEVARARCLSTTDPGLLFQTGWVTVLIVPESEENQPNPSQELINVVSDYLVERSTAHLVLGGPVQINVIPPEYLRVAVEADVAYVNINDAKLVEAAINQSLTDFFHPLRGGPDGRGWEFGRSVYVTEIYQRIETVPGVDYVTRAVIRGAVQAYMLRFALRPFVSLTPYPRGSRLIVTGVRGALNVSMRMITGRELKEDVSVSEFMAIGFRQGDRVVLKNGATELNLIVTDVQDGALTVSPAFALDSFPAGSTVETTNGRARSTLLVPVNANAAEPLTSLVVAVPAAGDDWELSYPGYATQIGFMDEVSDEVDFLPLGASNVTSSGVHTIRALQTAGA